MHREVFDFVLNKKYQKFLETKGIKPIETQQYVYYLRVYINQYHYAVPFYVEINQDYQPQNKYDFLIYNEHQQVVGNLIINKMIPIINDEKMIENIHTTDAYPKFKSQAYTNYWEVYKCLRKPEIYNQIYQLVNEIYYKEPKDSPLRIIDFKKADNAMCKFAKNNKISIPYGVYGYVKPDINLFGRKAYDYFKANQKNLFFEIRQRFIQIESDEYDMEDIYGEKIPVYEDEEFKLLPYYEWEDNYGIYVKDKKSLEVWHFRNKGESGKQFFAMQDFANFFNLQKEFDEIRPLLKYTILDRYFFGFKDAIRHSSKLADEFLEVFKTKKDMDFNWGDSESIANCTYWGEIETVYQKTFLQKFKNSGTAVEDLDELHQLYISCASELQSDLECYLGDLECESQWKHEAVEKHKKKLKNNQ